MGKIFESIDQPMRDWVAQQKMFFVATAPLAGDGHVNCSPKGIDSLRILSDSELGYLDITGSGVETIAHAHENGRIVIMLCSMQGPPRIVRFHGTATAIEPGDAEFDALYEHFVEQPAIRSIIHIKVHRIADACGYGVPFYEYQGEREIFESYAKRKGEQGLADYRAEKNRKSIDGLPGVKAR